jgi:hypothetical protein
MSVELHYLEVLFWVVLIIVGTVVTTREILRP